MAPCRTSIAPKPLVVALSHTNVVALPSVSAAEADGGRIDVATFEP